jgi:hypothetical protein
MAGAREMAACDTLFRMTVDLVQPMTYRIGAAR